MLTQEEFIQQRIDLLEKHIREGMYPEAIEAYRIEIRQLKYLLAIV